MSENELDIQYRLFVVGERPFCVWDTDIQSRALEFLDQVDASYFDYLADTHIQHISEDQPREKESQFAALAIRTAYSQALETFFALLCAAIQAPQCIHAWIDNYQSKELYSLVRQIQSRQPVISLLKISKPTWHTIAEAVFESLVLEDKERESTIKKEFGNLWSRFASQFLDEGLRDEYNSIKHGLRVRPGGFYVAMGHEKMQVIGNSEFGSSYFASQKIGNRAHHLEMKRHRRNWSPEALYWSLHLLSLSITNVKAALRILNGVPATDVDFQWPTDKEVFQEPWKQSVRIGITSMSHSAIYVRPEFIDPISKDEILKRYKAGEDAGVKRITFSGGPNADREAAAN